MIHLATIHYGDDSWIDPQLTYLARNTAEDYRVWACLDYIDPAQFENFHFAAARGEPIEAELRFLVEQISAVAEPDDMLVFLHGDTLPIREWSRPVRELLGAKPLVGIRREENLGEPHPHWCFTATTVGFWNRLGSDWSRGPDWIGSNGVAVSDYGASLWQDIETAGVEWEPLLRSNRRDLHPLWFGIYGGLIYHHGAAFRKPVEGAIRARIGTGHDPSSWPVSRLDAAQAPRPNGLITRLAHKGFLWNRARKINRDSARLYAALRADPEFWRELA